MPLLQSNSVRANEPSAGFLPLKSSPANPLAPLQQVENLYDIYLERDEYDVRYLTPNPFPQSYYIDYLNSETVQSAIGAFVNYSESNAAVGNAFGSTGDDDREIGTIAAMSALLSQNVSVTMYFGDADYNCNWLGGQVVATKLNASGYAGAGFTNISTTDNVVHGQVRQAGKYAFVRIYQSGHLVPFWKPRISLELVDRVINNLDIATGKTTIASSYVTGGPSVTSYREGNHTVQYTITPEGSTYNTGTDMPQNGTIEGGGIGKVKREVYSAKEARRMKIARRMGGGGGMRRL